MSEILYGWVGTITVGVGLMTGLWWALADFILDRVGPPAADWGSRERL